MPIFKSQSNSIVQWIILTWVFLLSHAAVADQIKAIPWIKLKTESSQAKQICQALKVNCGKDVEVWKKQSGADTHLYLTDDTPQLIEFIKENNQYVVLNSWSFQQYQHHGRNSDFDNELNNDGLSIYPAFYPLNRQKLAIAVVKRWSTTYSGGGRAEEIADFVMLEPNHAYKLALADVAFHSYEMIRACFYQEEYQSSPHCHDESGSNLSIQFKDIGKEYYQWRLNFTDFNWEAFKPESSKVVEKSYNIVVPFQQK
ncbi:hypothetical protein [Acinetobacter bereziniae]|uniref:hypothetical protein n=1 Tax=Acinetobacter bereziniae TaxID=106648 RepID=UPI003214DCC0